MVLATQGRNQVVPLQQVSTLSITSTRHSKSFRQNDLRECNSHQHLSSPLRGSFHRYAAPTQNGYSRYAASHYHGMDGSYQSRHSTQEYLSPLEPIRQKMEGRSTFERIIGDLYSPHQVRGTTLSRQVLNTWISWDYISTKMCLDNHNGLTDSRGHVQNMCSSLEFVIQESDTMCLI